MNTQCYKKEIYELANTLIGKMKEHKTKQEDIIALITEHNRNYINEILSIITDNLSEVEYEQYATEIGKMAELISDNLTYIPTLADKNIKYDDNLKIYIKDVNSIPLLTKEEEHHLAVRSNQGDIEARNQLINANLRLVVAIAKNYISNTLSYMDIIQNGNLGLIKATEKFDPYKGYRFSTYATWWIRQTIRRGLCNQSRAIRIPVNILEILTKYDHYVKEYIKITGIKPSEEEICEVLNITKERLSFILQTEADILYLDSQYGQDDNEVLGEFIKSDFNLEDKLCGEYLKKDIKELLNILNEREKKIIIEHYGLNGNKIKTLEELGQEQNVTRQRISAIEKKALIKMRKHQSINEIKEYL